MNTAQLSAWFQQNRTAVLGVAGVGVVGLALHSRKAKGDTGGGGATPTAMDTASTAFASAPAIAGTAPYNSSSSDVYSSLSPLINRLYEMQEQSAPTPVPMPGYYRPAGGTTVYELRSDGSLDWIEPAEGDALKLSTNGGDVRVTDVARDNALWGRKVVGNDSPRAVEWWPTGRPVA